LISSAFVPKWWLTMPRLEPGTLADLGQRRLLRTLLGDELHRGAEQALLSLGPTFQLRTPFPASDRCDSGVTPFSLSDG